MRTPMRSKPTQYTPRRIALAAVVALVVLGGAAAPVAAVLPGTTAHHGNDHTVTAEITEYDSNWGATEVTFRYDDMPDGEPVTFEVDGGRTKGVIAGPDDETSISPGTFFGSTGLPVRGSVTVNGQTQQFTLRQPHQPVTVFEGQTYREPNRRGTLSSLFITDIQSGPTGFYGGGEGPTRMTFLASAPSAGPVKFEVVGGNSKAIKSRYGSSLDETTIEMPNWGAPTWPVTVEVTHPNGDVCRMTLERSDTSLSYVYGPNRCSNVG